MPLLSPQALADTYDPPTNRDPWEQIQIYRQSQRYPEDWGAARVASAINADEEQPWGSLTRSNLRAWVDGDGMPDAACAVEVANKLGWTGDEWTPTTRAFAELVAGIFACGNIRREGWVPSWSTNSVIARSTIENALETAGVGHQFVERDTESRGDELRPRQHGSILGRALHASGAPVGDKNLESTAGLPSWMFDAPPSVQGSIAELLVRERGISFPDKATRRIQSSRHPEYFEDVAALIEGVTGEPANASDSGVTISANAVRALGLA